MNTPTNNVMDLISRLIGNPTGGGQPIATPSTTQQPQGPMIQQQQQPQLQPNQNNPQAAQLLRILQQNPNLLNSLSGNQGNQAMSSNVPNDVLLHFLQSQLNNSGVQFRRQPQGMSNMAGGGMSMTPQQPQTQNTLMGSDNSTNNMLVGDGNFGTAPPTTSSVGMVGDNTMINNAMLGGLAGINSTTPLGMMTMNGTNMNIPNQPKRSGTPLSNNSGGLSTNTTTTTMTQSGFSNGTRKFSVDHIKLVQQLIEQCLKLYLSKTETMEFLCSRYDHIDPAFINLMWFKLEQQNPEFFKAYNTRLQIKDQITQFNQLVKDQAQQMQQQGLLIQNANSGFQMAMPNSQNMNNSPQIPLTISSNIPQSMNPYSSSPVTMNTFVTTPSNTPNMATTIGASTNMTNPMNMNTGGGGGFVYPNNLMNTSQSPNTAMVGGMQNQGSNSVSSLGNINLQQGTNTLNFAQQQNMYRSQTQPQTVTNSQQQLSQNFSTPNNSSSPQKRTIDSMNISSTTTMGNTAYNEDHTATSNNTTFAGNSQPNMDTNQMINPRQVVQNFMKSPPVMIPASAAQAMMAPSTSNNPETISVNSNASNRQQVQNSNNTASNALQQGASANDSSLSSLNQQTATSNSATHNNQTSSQQDATSALDSSSFGGFDFPETGDLFGDTEDFDFNF